MKGPVLALAALVLVTCANPAIAADEWYVHRTSHLMHEPPWYCYCYRVTNTNVIPGIVAYEMAAGLSREQALDFAAGYADEPETCSGICTGGDANADNQYPPYYDLSGRWQTVGTDMSLDFTPAENGLLFSAEAQGFLVTMTTRLDGRVDLEMAANGRSVQFIGDLSAEDRGGQTVDVLDFSPTEGAVAENFRAFTMTREN